MKAVEVLVRVKGITERDALLRMHRWLMSAQAVQDATAGYVAPAGHESACQEASAMLLSFPAHRWWTSTVACSPWVSHGLGSK